MPTKTLVIGYGNPGRLDDGLGPALAEAFEHKSLPEVTVDADYQLTVEDAAVVAEHAAVVFVDAAVNGPEPFAFRPIDPVNGTLSFSSHSVEPEAVVSMAHSLFGSDTRAYALAIRGYEFNEFGERLSDHAQGNLDKAIAFLEGTLKHDLLEEAADVPARRARGENIDD